jgi:hypothetical protein
LSSRRLFSYAGTVKGVGRRVRARPALTGARLPADWKKLAVSETGERWEGLRSLGLPARLLVTAALVAICVAVLNKEPVLHDQAANALGAAGEKMSNWLVRPAGAAAPRPAEAAGRPVVVETAPARFKPVALVSDGGIFALGADGEVKTCGPECTAERFPVVTGLPVREVPGTMGVMLKTTADMDVIRTVLGAPWVEQLSEINLAELPALVLYTRDGLKIKLNADASLAQNLRRLATVLQDLRARGQVALAVDARYKDQMVVTPSQRK